MPRAATGSGEAFLSSRKARVPSLIGLSLKAIEFGATWPIAVGLVWGVAALVVKVRRRHPLFFQDDRPSAKRHT